MKKDFKDYLQANGFTEDQIYIVSQYENKYNADTLERHDGSIYYSEAYLELMMKRERQRGYREGLREPEIHIAKFQKS